MSIEFCTDPFFDVDLFWNTLSPDLTHCFQFLLLRLLPCVVLLVLHLAGLTCLLRARRPPHLEEIGIGWLQITQLVVVVIFGGASLGDLIYSSFWFFEDKQRSIVQLLAPTAEIITSLFAVAFYLLEYSRLYFHNPGFFVFWFLESVFYLIQLYSTAVNFSDGNYARGDGFRVGTTTVHLASALTSFVLTCFSPLNNLPGGEMPFPVERLQIQHRSRQLNFLQAEDSRVNIGRRFEDRKKSVAVDTVVRYPCPEETCSPLSFLSFFWLFDLVIKGYKKPLEKDDMWTLRESEKVLNVSGEFLPLWQRLFDQWSRTNIPPKPLALQHQGHVNSGLTREDAYEMSDMRSPASPTTRAKSVRWAERTEEIENAGGAQGNGVARRGQESAAQKPTEPVSVPPLFSALIQVFWKQYVSSQIVFIFYLLFQYSGPVLLWLIIEFMGNSTIQEWKGYMAAVVLFLGQTGQSFCYQNGFHMAAKVSVRVRSAIMDVLYRKAIIISPASAASGGGDIVTLLAVDLQRIQDTLQFLYIAWLAPASVVIAGILLFVMLGWPSLVGLFFMLVCFFVNYAVGIFIQLIIKKNLLIKDKRVRFMNEVLNGIKVVKLYAWEPAFSPRIYGYRKQELTYIFKFFAACIVPFVVFNTLAFFTTAITLIIYVNAGDGVLNQIQVFVSLAIFQMLQVPIGLLPLLINIGAGALIGLKRLSKFLGLPEVDPNNVERVNTPETRRYPIIVQDASFAWKPNGEPVLKNINLRVQRGELVAVVGSVGSGKSTLVSALIGETEKLSGHVNIVTNRIAFVSQQAWILNATVRDNILFGRPWDPVRYEQTIEACALKTDLEILSAGDATEIGERGINLSGGQKQRISVARAVYNDADLYIFDDPLSAVDVHVGKHLFEHVIGPNGMLAQGNKTRVLVTHGIHYLPHCDRIVCLSERKIREQGSYSELLSAEGQFANVIHAFLEEGQREEDDEPEPDEEEVAAGKPLPAVQMELAAGGALAALPVPYRAGSSKQAGQNEAHEAVSYVEEQRPRALSRPRGYSRLESQVASAEKERDRHNGEFGIVGDSDQKRPSIGSLTKKGKAGGETRRVSGQMVSKPPPPPAAPAPAEEAEKKNKLIEEESEATGHVKLSDYFWYISSMGAWLFVVFLCFFVLYMAAQIIANIFLSQMGSDVNLSINSTQEEQNQAIISAYRRDTLIYLGFGFVQVIFLTTMSLAYSWMVPRASRLIHTALLERLLRAPMSFFDTTPTGRILNRFSKDLDMIDFMLPDSFRTFLTMNGQIVAIFIVISISTPIFLAVLVPVLLAFLVLIYFYMPTSRQLRRIESTTRSPVFSYIAATLQGRSTIRAYAVEDQFINEQARRTDENHVFNFGSLVSNRLLGFYVDLTSNILIFATAIFAVLGRDNGLNAGTAGLSIAYSMSISSVANLMVRLLNELEMNAVSIERTKEYTKIVNEAAWTIEATRPPKEWPQEGRIVFKNYVTRYRDGLEPVLKGLDLRVQPMEKVGICGRTGAGKSSLTLSLFRLIEAISGGIEIDSMPIDRLGLHQLRSRLTILPQDPVIFSGTLRFNLDPFNQYNDEQLWLSLEHAYLKDFFMAASAENPDPSARGLNFEVHEGGSNLSVGQRQLLCLSRALLRRTRVLVLDEATAAVDYETDSLIQATIRTEFRDCTVLTIAHRINTILDADKILVLDQGRLKEFDSPKNLISCGPTSSFYQMVQEAGLLRNLQENSKLGGDDNN